MDDRAPGEVDRVQAARAEKPAAPLGVRERAVDDQRPQADEDQVAAEAHPLAERPRDERRGDDGELHLERHVHQRRNRGGVAVRRAVDAAQHHVLQAADHPPVIGAERQRVPHDHPQQADHADRHEGLDHRRDHVLRAYQPSVEQREPRHHEEHQRRRGQHPGGVTSIDVHANLPMTAAPLPRHAVDHGSPLLTRAPEIAGATVTGTTKHLMLTVKLMTRSIAQRILVVEAAAGVHREPAGRALGAGLSSRHPGGRPRPVNDTRAAMPAAGRKPRPDRRRRVLRSRLWPARSPRGWSGRRRAARSGAGPRRWRDAARC